MKTLVTLSLLGLAAFVLWVVYELWVSVVVDMPGWAWATLIVGVSLGLAVGFGLMALLFYSDRHGYDESPRRVDPQ